MRYYLAVLLLLSTSAGASQQDVLRFYVAPVELGGNDDGNDGLSIAAPLATIQKVHTILKDERQICNGRQTEEVEIHILPATYVGHAVSWTCFTGAPITFTSLNFSSVRPVFVGGGTECAGQPASSDCPHTWFAVEDRYGVQGMLRFRYLKVQNYGQAMGFKRVGGNYLYGMYFYRIGSKYGPLGVRSDGSLSEPTSAIAFQKGSSHNRVANSHFINVENSSQGGRIHAFYISDFSARNVIERSRFAYVSGTPIKVRNSSSFNRVLASSFNRTGDVDNQGRGGFLSDGFDETNECPSWENEFSDNQLYVNYFGQRYRSPWIADPATYQILGRCGWYTGPRIWGVRNVQY